MAWPYRSMIQRMPIPVPPVTVEKAKVGPVPGGIQEKAAQKTAQNEAQGIGHGKIGLSLDPVCGRRHVVDPVDGGHSVQGISCGLKDLNAIEEEYTGASQVSRAWRKKERPAKRDPAPAGSPAEQEGEEHHGGDVHKALEGEKGSHFPLPPPRYWTI